MKTSLQDSLWVFVEHGKCERAEFVYNWNKCVEIRTLELGNLRLGYSSLRFLQ